MLNPYRPQQLLPAHNKLVLSAVSLRLPPQCGSCCWTMLCYVVLMPSLTAGLCWRV